MDEEDYEDSPWNSVGSSGNFNQAISQSIEASDANLDLDKSFYENGGTSLSAISTLLALKEQGSQISMEDFLQINSLRTLSNASLSATIEGLSNNLTFQEKALSEVSAEKAQNLLAECFTQKGDLERQKGEPLATEDFAALVRIIWPALLRHSFVIVDPKGELLAVAAIADAEDMTEFSFKGCHPYVLNVFNYLAKLTTNPEVKDQLPKESNQGVVLEKVLLGTSLLATPAENVYLMYLMENGIHKRANQLKFKMSISQNTSPLTQQLAEFFGCKRILTDKPHYYINEKGEEPFRHLSDSIIVTVDFKEY